MTNPNWTPPSGPYGPQEPRQEGGYSPPFPSSDPSSPFASPEAPSPFASPDASGVPVGGDPSYPGPGGYPAPGNYAQQPTGYAAPGYAAPGYAGPGHQPAQNYGLAAPAQYYELVVPRPPRPPTVRRAVLLAYIGAAFSLVFELVNTVITFTVTADRLSGDPNLPVTTDGLSGVLGVALLIGMLIQLAYATGVVVCARLSNRGSNPGRIVLVVLMGVAALDLLCGVGALALTGAVGTSAAPMSINSAMPLPILILQIGCEVLLAVMAVAIFVMLLLPASNNFFTAGPGRRFAPGQ